jgi:hypothetical protein
VSELHGEKDSLSQLARMPGFDGTRGTSSPQGCITAVFNLAAWFAVIERPLPNILSIILIKIFAVERCCDVEMERKDLWWVEKDCGMEVVSLMGVMGQRVQGTSRAIHFLGIIQGIYTWYYILARKPMDRIRQSTEFRLFSSSIFRPQLRNGRLLRHGTVLYRRGLRQLAVRCFGAGLIPKLLSWHTVFTATVVNIGTRKLKQQILALQHPSSQQRKKYFTAASARNSDLSMKLSAVHHTTAFRFFGQFNACIELKCFSDRLDS